MLIDASAANVFIRDRCLGHPLIWLYAFPSNPDPHSHLHTKVPFFFFFFFRGSEVFRFYGIYFSLVFYFLLSVVLFTGHYCLDTMQTLKGDFMHPILRGENQRLIGKVAPSFYVVYLWPSFIGVYISNGGETVVRPVCENSTHR